MRKSKGRMSSSTRKLRKNYKKKGKPPVNRYLQEFAEGATVHISIESSEHKGMPDPKYQGKTGKIVEKRGRSYVVQIRDGNKQKQLIVAPVHMRA